MAGAAEAEQAMRHADEAFARFDVEAAVAHLSAAIRGFTAAGEKCQAAMACVRLGDVLANAMGNLTAGRAWFARARRLVEDEPPCLEQGWVAVAAMGCDVDDPDELLAAAELALDRARRFGDVNLETKALADAGLAHVQAGRVAQGMALLDEAMALACGPADDEDAAAKSACSFFTACYFAAEFHRADSWAALLRQQGLIGAAPGGPLFVSSHCDSVQATLLFELGRWSDAEALLTRAKTEFETAMPAPAWHPDIALADLRIRQGRYAEAEALLLGKDQAMQALLPAARLHLARGDHDLARATALRGLRAIGADRLRAVELLTVLVDAELGRGDLDGARAACADLLARTAGVDVPALVGRAAAAQSRLLAADGQIAAGIDVLERALDHVHVGQLPWLHATLLLDLARLRAAGGDRAGATVDAKTAAAVLDGLDVALSPSDAAFLDALREPARDRAQVPTATLRRDGKWWTVSAGTTTVRLPDTKGLRYLAELVRRPGAECHVLDLVDAAEGIAAEGDLDRRRVGDAGPVVDARARADYRRRIEALRGDVDDALARGALDEAERLQSELDALVRQLAQAFGLGGRSRPAASAAERARLNVTRAVRAATARLAQAVPEAGTALDRHVRTGVYCAYEPACGEVRWTAEG